VDADEPIECSELFGFDAAHFRYCAALWVFKEQVGLPRLSEIMVQAYDLENCEPIGKC
jgi:hypothetical protein